MKICECGNIVVVFFIIVGFHHSKGAKYITRSRNSEELAFPFLSHSITDTKTLLVWKCESGFSGVLHPCRVLCAFCIFKSQFNTGQGPVFKDK